MTDKVAVVTGGTTGIGLATTRRLLGDGFSVMMASRDRVRGARVAAALGSDRIAFHQVDVTDEASVTALVEEVARRFGRIDGLFNNAGVEGTVGPMAAWPAEVVDEVLRVNVTGPFLCMKHAAPLMPAGSVIVNCSSLLGTIPMPMAAPYAASKAALLSLTRSAAAELSERSIVVFAICPGVVDTPMMDRVSAMAGAPKQVMAEMVCPSQQLTMPDTVAEAVAELFASPASWDSGSALRVGPDARELVA